MRVKGFVFIVLTGLLGCKSAPEKPGAFSLMEHTGISFNNSITNTADFNIFNYRNFYNGAGVAIGDLDNDGLPEIFFTANMGSNKLFRNKGNFSFEDISEKAGIGEALKWSTGVVLADVNGDGWLDIYVCNAGHQKGQIQDNALFINNKNLTFTDKAHEFGLADAGYTTHAAFFDYDLDGDLDCYILNNSFIPVNTINYANKRELRAENWPVADYLKGGGDKLMRNDGGKFIDVSEAAHIYGSLIGFGLGVAIGDVNGDRYPDIYVSNDFFEKDYLYINQQDGSFREELENRIQHISHSSMGVDIGDINNDDHPDIFVTEMLPDDELRLKTTTTFENIDIQKLKQKSGFYNQFQQNTLQVNNGSDMFYETAFYSGVAASDWSWGGLIFDADNDKLNDIFVCNGIYNDVTDQDFIDFFANDVIQKMVLTGNKEDILEIIKKMPSNPIRNKFYHNKGNLKFEDESSNWGMDLSSFSNGAAYGDLDNDGDADLVVNNVNGPAFVYRNNEQQTTRNNYLAVQLKGDAPNTFAVGSLVKVFIGKEILRRELFPARGFQSSVDYKMLFGLGKSQPDSLQVIWPDKSTTTIIKPAINKLHVLSINAATGLWTRPVPTIKTELAIVGGYNFEAHHEDEFMDFNVDRNIPVLLSREGPHIATADVNLDGKADFYIAGAAGQSGQLYLQTNSGIKLSPQVVFEQFKQAEDVAVLFFDVDNDKDPDLFIGSGGNTGTDLQHRLYLNDGKGDFSAMDGAFPVNTMNISVAANQDIDGDGDQDLFVGGRSIPGQYGVAASSYIYVNDGHGHFTDLTSQYCGALVKPGMITAAVWADITGDKSKELIIVGEWMAPRIFSIANQKLIERKTNLDSLNGWWQTVAIADLDKDGRNDLVFGNLGQNSYLGSGGNLPLRLWINDFDENGTIDKIVSKNVKGRDLPVFMKRELIDQLPTLQKQNLKHAEYANKSIPELFSNDIIASATVKLWKESRSIIAWNEGDGKFALAPMPYQVQLSSVNAVAIGDFSGDSLPDLILAGNMNTFQPQFGVIDGSYGKLLINKGQRNFALLPDAGTGLMVTGVTKEIAQIPLGGIPSLVFVRNNQAPQVYRKVKAVSK